MQRSSRMLSSCMTETLPAYPLKLCLHDWTTPHFCLPQTLTIITLLHSLTLLGTSFKWNTKVFVFLWLASFTWASQVALVAKNPLANAGDVKVAGLTPGPERSPGGGLGNPLGITSSRFIHIVGENRFSFPLMLNNTPLCIYSTFF